MSSPKASRNVRARAKAHETLDPSASSSTLGAKKPKGSGNELTDLSGAVFRVRRTLLEQFSRIERDMESRFRGDAQKFASRDELIAVMGKMHEFRGALDGVLLSVEERLQGASENVYDRLRAQLRAELVEELRRESPEGRAGGLDDRGGLAGGHHPPVWDDWLSGINPFNLRRKYHEASLSLRAEEVDAFGYDPIFDNFVRPLFDFLYSRYWRVEAYGLSHIPARGPCLIVGNHSGSLPYDATMLKMAVLKEHPSHREIRFMVEDFLFHFPFLGSLMNRFGGVRASQENAEQLLESQFPVVVFPEGVKGLGKLHRDKYHLARFGRGGFIRLCLRTRAPLVPVAFIGPEEIHPMLMRETFLAGLLGVPYIPITPTFPWFGPLGLIPLPSKWSIHCMPAIDFSNYGPGAEKDRVLVSKMSKRVKDMIQDTIVDKLKLRRSIWFG
ncbi:MAG: acyltransferase family protein [Silvanigrellales bacterium]|nr:acyltransferase family protein [Silvanigrellales bacterium]